MSLSSGVWKQITIKRNYKPAGINAVDNWKTFATVSGYVQLGNGREYHAAKQTIPELSGIAELRQHVHGIGSDMVLEIDGIDYELAAPAKGIRELNYMELHFKKVK